MGSAAAARAPKTTTMSIGIVLKRLQVEFPDVSVSKIRFLETEGLVSPARTASGYRRFTDADVERLRYILTVQRDKFLPLKVIREQLVAMDEGTMSSIMPVPVVSADSFRQPATGRLTDREVAEQAGVEEEVVANALSLGLIAPDRAGYFSADDVALVRTLVALREVGFDDRALRMLKNSASRQADLIRRVVQPATAGTDSADRHRAEELSQEVAAQVISLVATVVKGELLA